MKLVFYILGLITFLSCNNVVKNENLKYFEGFVEAKINISSSNKNIVNKFKSEYGERLITYINKNGFYSREFIDSNNIIISKEVFNPDSLRLYHFQSDHNIVKYYDVIKNNRYQNVLVEWGDTLTILNNPVRGVKSINKYTEKESGKSYDYVTTTYNSPDYTISPNAYKNMRILGIDKMFAKAPFVSVGTTIQFGNFAAMKIIATRVISTDVANLHFEIPKNAILIEQ